MWRCVLGALCAFAIGCSDDGSADLAVDVVTNLPDGTGTGTTASGEYDVELYTAACGGGCVVDYQGFTISLCDVGSRDSVTLTVTQTEGHLQVDVPDDSLYVTRLEGGIDEAGGFDVGGYATQQGGTVTITARVRGTLVDGALAGTALAHGDGNVDGHGIDCIATYELTGTRR